MPTWTGVIAVENVLSQDGRLIEEGALEWDDEFGLVLLGDSGVEGGNIVGLVRRVWREGRMIRASGTSNEFLEVGSPLSVSVTGMEVSDDTTPMMLIVSKAQLRVVSTTPSAWAACVVEEVGE